MSGALVISRHTLPSNFPPFPSSAIAKLVWALKLSYLKMPIIWLAFLADYRCSPIKTIHRSYVYSALSLSNAHNLAEVRRRLSLEVYAAGESRVQLLLSENSSSGMFFVAKKSLCESTSLAVAKLLLHDCQLCLSDVLQPSTSSLMGNQCDALGAFAEATKVLFGNKRTDLRGYCVHDLTIVHMLSASVVLTQSDVARATRPDTCIECENHVGAFMLPLLR